MVSPLALELLLRLACAYAMHEQFRAHSSAHAAAALFRTNTNLSGAFMAGIAKKSSPLPSLTLHFSSSLRRHPCENLPMLHSEGLAGSKPSRQSHDGAATVLSQ